MSRVKTSRTGWLFGLLAIMFITETTSCLEHQFGGEDPFQRASNFVRRPASPSRAGHETPPCDQGGDSPLELSRAAPRGQPRGIFAARQQPADLSPFFAKRQVTIAVTDSGLGGLSIMAEAVARLKEAKIFEKADFVFFNALFSNESGYNSLKTRAEKIAVFNSALDSLEKNYRPDLVLIGCNTLSVLTRETSFSKRAKIPVVGIVDAGVGMFLRALKANPAASLILFGTETTIGEGEHKRKLMEAGIPEKRIIAQACPELAGYIENGYQSDETALLIESVVEEALAKLADPKVPVYAGLACTHYGYSLSLWNKAFEERGLKLQGILNPNSRMLDFLFESGDKNRVRTTEISARIVSMVEIAENKRQSLGGWLEKVSPEVASALTKYELKPDLFKWQDPRRSFQTNVTSCRPRTSSPMIRAF